MNPSTSFEALFAIQPVMAVIRGLGPERTVELAKTAWNLGINCVEVPIQSETDITTLRATVSAAAANGNIVGAGTVVNEEIVRKARNAGAQFTVSPGLNLNVIDASLDAGMLSLPGVATPTEVQIAEQYGLQWVKAFPASVLGLDWFSAMHGPFPQMKFVATGGIDARNAASFLSAGAAAISVGSALSDPKQLPLLAELIEAQLP